MPASEAVLTVASRVTSESLYMLTCDNDLSCTRVSVFMSLSRPDIEVWVVLEAHDLEVKVLHRDLVRS